MSMPDSVVAPPPAYLPNPHQVTYPPPIGTYPSSQTVVVLPVLGPHEQVLQCPSCYAMVTTKIKVEPNSSTHLKAALMCLIACCCIPYLCNSCQDVNHYCPNCNSYIGTHCHH